MGALKLALPRWIAESRTSSIVITYNSAQFSFQKLVDRWGFAPHTSAMP